MENNQKIYIFGYDQYKTYSGKTIYLRNSNLNQLIDINNTFTILKLTFYEKLTTYKSFKISNKLSELILVKLDLTDRNLISANELKMLINIKKDIYYSIPPYYTYATKDNLKCLLNLKYYFQ